MSISIFDLVSMNNESGFQADLKLLHSVLVKSCIEKAMWRYAVFMIMYRRPAEMTLRHHTDNIVVNISKVAEVCDKKIDVFNESIDSSMLYSLSILGKWTTTSSILYLILRNF